MPVLFGCPVVCLDGIPEIARPRCGAYSAPAPASPVRDADGLFQIEDEQLAVADPSVAGRVADRLYGPLGDIGADGDLDPDFRHEMHLILGAAINFLVAALPPRIRALR